MEALQREQPSNLLRDVTPLKESKCYPLPRQTPLQEDELCCPICLELYYRPKVLPCGHSFCVLCLQNYINSSWSIFKCPSCRCPLRLPPSGVLGLASNTFLKEAVESFREKELGKEMSRFFTKEYKNAFVCIEDKNDSLGNSVTLQEPKSTSESKDSQIHSGIENNVDFRPSSTDSKVSSAPPKLVSKGTQTPEETKCRKKVFGKGPCCKKSCSSLKPVIQWRHGLGGRPGGVAVHPLTSNIYVTESDSCRILIFDAKGKRIGGFGSKGFNDDQLLCPSGIAFNIITSEILITDKWKHCIHVFNVNGSYGRQIGRRGKGYGHFTSPEGIAVDQRGFIYVADTCNDRVQILDSDGVFVKEIGVVSFETLKDGRRYTKNELNEPTGIHVSPDGSKVYVADAGNNRVKVFDGSTCERLLMFGSKGKNKGQFDSPECVVLSPDGCIVVGDSGNGRVQIFKPNGSYIRHFRLKGRNHREYGWASGVAVLKSREIVVADFKHKSLSMF